jgi:hypothetical protein
MEDSYQVERRSTRIRAQIPLRLTSLEATGSFSESCHTLVVNTEGCGVRLSRPLEPGAAVRLDEMPSGNAMDGRVANCVPLGPKHWLVGIQLEEPETSGESIPRPPIGILNRKPWPHSPR